MSELEKPVFTLRVRGRTQLAAKAKHIDGLTAEDKFKQAIELKDCPEPEPVIEWVGVEEIAALDLDYHGEYRPDEAEFFRMASQLAIRPRYHWRTHGGGWRGIFFAQEPLSAEEQAALVVFQLKDDLAFKRATGYEVKPHTRHPAYPRNGERAGGVITDRPSNLHRARCIYLSGEDPQVTIADDVVKEWLLDRGMDGKDRFDHEHCLWNPCPGHAEPVVLYEDRIHCFKCSRSEKWSKLVHGAVKPAVNHLKLMVKNRVHWAQAKYEIGSQYEIAYRAMLKLFHLRGDSKDEEMKKLIGKVFFPEICMILVDGLWVKDETFERLKEDVSDGYIGLLPSAHYVAEKKEGELVKIETGVSPYAELDFRAVNKLERYGYRSIQVLHGLDIAEHMRGEHGESGPIAIRPAVPPFTYRSSRPDDDERVRERLEKCFPSINVPLLKLLVACKGLLQYRANDVPRIYVTGQSGAGKSITLQVAASICCDSVEELYFKDGWERFIRSFADAGLRSSFAFIDEVDKTSLSQTELKSRFLDFAQNKSFHRMYGGSAKVMHPPAVYLTGTNLMSYLLADEQITRRFALIELGAGRLGDLNPRNWKETCGCDSAINWRAASPENAEVSDILVSRVMRDHFMDHTRVPLFEDLVKHYGFAMMSEFRVDADELLREFYAAVSGDPEWTGGSYWKEPSWRVYDVNDHGRAMSLYKDITNEGQDIQPLTAANWTRITGKPGMTFARPRDRGKRIGFRFFQESRGGAGGGSRQRS